MCSWKMHPVGLQGHVAPVNRSSDKIEHFNTCGRRTRLARRIFRLWKDRSNQTAGCLGKFSQGSHNAVPHAFIEHGTASRRFVEEELSSLIAPRLPEGPINADL